MRALTLAVAAALLIAACAGTPSSSSPAGTPRRALGPRDTEYTLRHDNVMRTYVLHAPPGAEAKSGLPVVVVLWDNGSADSAIAGSGWSQKADAEGFLVAYGQADRGLWNDGSAAGEAGRVKNGDVGYVSALFGDAARHFNTDPQRLFVAGFGNGGSLAWLSAAEASGRVTAVAALGGHLYPEKLNIARGTSFLYLVGSADPQYPLNGGRVITAAGNAEQRPPLQQTFDRWLALMRCGMAPEKVRDADGVKVFAYRACRDGTESLLQTVDGLGHLWPGAPLPTGIPSPDRVNATAVFWDFFRSHLR